MSRHDASTSDLDRLVALLQQMKLRYGVAPRKNRGDYIPSLKCKEVIRVRKLVVEDRHPRAQEVLASRFAARRLGARRQTVACRLYGHPLVHLVRLTTLELEVDRGARRIGPEHRYRTGGPVYGGSGADQRDGGAGSHPDDPEVLAPRSSGAGHGKTPLVDHRRLRTRGLWQRDRDRGGKKQSSSHGSWYPAGPKRVHDTGAGARKTRSLIRLRIRSYSAFPFSAVASVGRPIDPGLPFGTFNQPRR